MVIMNKNAVLSFLLIAFITAFAVSCTGKKSENKKTDAIPETAREAAPAPAPVIGQETLLLLKDLEDNGDYVNSQYFPSLIKASVVNGESGKNNLILDLRTPELFAQGHIKGAVNKKFEQLPDYF